MVMTACKQHLHALDFSILISNLILQHQSVIHTKDFYTSLLQGQEFQVLSLCFVVDNSMQYEHTMENSWCSIHYCTSIG